MDRVFIFTARPVARVTLTLDLPVSIDLVNGSCASWDCGKVNFTITYNGSFTPDKLGKYIYVYHI